MQMSESVFMLLKSDPSASSVELARFLQRFPGVDGVWMTEGAYSFIAKFSAPEGAVPLLARRIAKHKAVLELECVRAPISME